MTMTGIYILLSHHHNTPGGVQDMDCWLRIPWSDLDGRVLLGGCGSTNEQRDLQFQSLHLLGDMDHFVQRRRDEAGQPEDVGSLLQDSLHYSLARHHHAHVDDLEVVAAQYNAHNVLPDV